MSQQLTLLLITGSQLARVDLVRGRRKKVKNIWFRERIKGETIATLADAAIRLGPKKTGDVWVLSSDFWTGIVHLAADVSRSLEGAELEQAIALEAETYSGISAFDSRLGTKPMPPAEMGERRWWVTQIAQSDWIDVKDTITQFGGKLAGMGHAALGSLPECSQPTVNDTEQQSWRLIQCFGEMTIGVQGVDSGLLDIITLGNLSTQRNRSQLNEWWSTGEIQDERVVWVTDGPIDNGLITDACTVLSLTGDEGVEASGMAGPLSPDPFAPDSPRAMVEASEAAFRIWAETIAASLEIDRLGAVTGLPMAVSEKPPMSNQTAALVACGLGLVVALGCFALHSTASSRLETLTREVETLDAQKKRLANEKKSLADSEKKLAANKATLADLQARTYLLQSNLEEAVLIRQFQHTRWLKLVNAIAQAHHDDLWVRGVASDGDKVTVKGMAVSNQDVTDFTSKLENFASPHGWQVHPAQTQRNEMALVDFEVDLDVSDRAVPATSTGASTVASDVFESSMMAQR
ncbi:MAG: PilN domain-containing protein [Planctomycetota bacterium]